MGQPRGLHNLAWALLSLGFAACADESTVPAEASACGGIYLLGGSALGGVVDTVQRLDGKGWSVSR